MLSGSASTSLRPINERRSLGGQRPRRFSSRHVPAVAEEIVHSEMLTSSMATRFNGLMKHLKHNSALEEDQKTVLTAGAPETLVPERSVTALREEFERRCAFGERMNLELMGSAKWTKLLEDIGVLPPPSGRDSCDDSPNSGCRSPGASPKFAAAAETALEGEAPTNAFPLNRADADIIFMRVLYNCCHGGQRLDYELFCKALLLTGTTLWPGEAWEVVMQSIVDRILDAAPPQQQDPSSPAASASPGGASELAHDAEIIMALDGFRPALHDLFEAFASQSLINPGSPTRGKGAVRVQERPVTKAAQDPMAAATLSGASMAELMRVARRIGASAENAMNVAEPTSPMMPSQSVPALPIASRWACSETIGRTFTAITQGSNGSSLGGSPDVCRYANGSPVILNRRQMMSCDQFMTICKHMGIMPELLSRAQVVRIFKKAEASAAGPEMTTGLHGFLSRDAFVDAMGQLGIQAFSQEPFCDEYPEVPGRVVAFLSGVLPTKSVTVRDRFFFGRG